MASKEACNKGQNSIFDKQTNEEGMIPYNVIMFDSSEQVKQFALSLLKKNRAEQEAKKSDARQQGAKKDEAASACKDRFEFVVHPSSYFYQLAIIKIEALQQLDDFNHAAEQKVYRFKQKQKRRINDLMNVRPGSKAPRSVNAPKPYELNVYASDDNGFCYMEQISLDFTQKMAFLMAEVFHFLDCADIADDVVIAYFRDDRRAAEANLKRILNKLEPRVASEVMRHAHMFWMAWVDNINALHARQAQYSRLGD